MIKKCLISGAVVLPSNVLADDKVLQVITKSDVQISQMGAERFFSGNVRRYAF
ncbi:MAG: hypothetical protein LBJ88_00390 [Campylobacteraceae bacterium]|nr:hypothetical protein [Campylobacteraceae bacterium]